MLEPYLDAATQSQRGWSINGAKRSQPVAAGRKSDTGDSGSNRPIGNRWQPTATVPNLMVRRGSPVRVRKRAFTKAQQMRGFRFADELQFVQRAQVWNRFWNSQTKKAPIPLSSQTSEHSCGPVFQPVLSTERDEFVRVLRLLL